MNLQQLFEILKKNYREKDLASDSQPGAISALGTFGKSGGILVAMTETSITCGWSPGMLLNILHCTGQLHTNKNYLAPNAEVEKPWPSEKGKYLVLLY